MLDALKDRRDIVAAAGVDCGVLNEDLFVLNDSRERFRTNIVEDRGIWKKRPIWARPYPLEYQSETGFCDRHLLAGQLTGAVVGGTARQSSRLVASCRS